MIWLVSYRARPWRRGFDGSLTIFTNTNENLDLIDQHPLAWLIEQKKRLSSLKNGEQADEIELIYSAVECPDSDELAAWWDENA
jgi:hypothetical protein